MRAEFASSEKASSEEAAWVRWCLVDWAASRLTQERTAAAAAAVVVVGIAADIVVGIVVVAVAVAVDSEDSDGAVVVVERSRDVPGRMTDSSEGSHYWAYNDAAAAAPRCIRNATAAIVAEGRDRAGWSPFACGGRRNNIAPRALDAGWAA